MAEPAAQFQKLRSELKVWEKSFASTNQKRKAGRDDIKKHPDIAQKYKEYNALRSLLSEPAQSARPQSSSSPPHILKKRELRQSQSKSTRSLQSSNLLPQSSQQHQGALHPANLDPYDSPRALHSTPKHRLRTSIGPTPQKNGQVLGLFDLLSPASPEATPSRKRSHTGSGPNKSLQATPSKSRISNPIFCLNESSATPQHSRTPQSSTKRTYLDAFLTPSTRRINEQVTPLSRVGVSRLNFDQTPEFLRRNAPRMILPSQTSYDQTTDENGVIISFSPVAIRLPPKPVGQTLSALVRNLRSLEDEKLDDELNLLHELEADDTGGGIDTDARTYIHTAPKRPKLLVRDSQIEMPLGADGEGTVSEDEEVVKEGLGRDGKPPKIWKKKGQKRSTRRVNLKPNTGKWKPEKEWTAGVETQEDNANNEDKRVHVVETQNLSVGSEKDSQDRTGDDVEGENPKPQMTGGDHGPSKETVKKAKKPKKISATAHANFRTLNIKNKQSKGKRGGRFGRRR